MTRPQPADANSPWYVCYDLRAIQSYIFRVPKLKYIVGGSALVDRFDRVLVPVSARRTARADLLGHGKERMP